MEPIHDLSPRTTATSASEGRLKQGFNRNNAQRKARHKKIYGTLSSLPKKRKYLKKRLLDVK